MGTRYAHKKVRNSLESSIKHIEETRSDPIAWKAITNKPEMEERLRKDKEHLARITPPDLKADDGQKVIDRLRVLEEAMIKGVPKLRIPPMPSHRQMEQDTAGAVGQHVAWEQSWKRMTIDSNGTVRDKRPDERGVVFEWKDARRTLFKDREDYDPDVANLEMIRPADKSVPLSDNHLPVSYGFSQQFKERYAFAFPDHEPTEVEKKLEETKAEQVTWERCQSTTKSGSQCQRHTKSPEVPFCGVHAKDYAKPQPVGELVYA